MAVTIKSGDSIQQAVVKPASTAATTSDPALVVTVSPNSAATPVSGSVSVSNFPATQPVSGTVTVAQATAANLNATVTGTVAVSNLPATQPVSGTVAVSNFPATQPVSGTVTANIGTTNGLALDATLTGGTQKAIARGGAKGATTAADVTSTSIDANTQALDVSVKGTASVSVNNFPGTQAVSGTVSVSNFPATQTVAGTVTANAGTGTFAVSATALPLPTGAATSAKQPALGTAGTPSADVLTVQGATSMTALKVDGSAVTQPISGSVSVSNFPGTQPVSGTVAATQSGTWNINALTSITNPVTVTGTVTANAGTGTFAVSAASLPLPTGAATAAKQPALGTAGTPSADVLTVQGSTSMTALKVDGSAVTQPVSGTVAVNNFPATQPVSGTVTVAQATAANLNATVTGTVAATQSGTWNVGTVSTITNPVTVTGTVTSNIGTTNGLALDATLTGGTQKAIARGGAKGSTTAADVTSTNVDANTQALDVSIKGTPSVSVSNFPGTQPVSGTVTVAQATAANLNATVTGTVAATQSGTWNVGTVTSITNPVSAAQSGTWTVQPGNTANTTPWLASISQGGNTATVSAANALKVDGSAVTQPVSGTVTANAGTGNFTVVQSTAANLNATVTGTVAATQSGTWNIGTVGSITSIVDVEGGAANGGTPVGNPVLTAGTDGTNVRTLRTDSLGRPQVVLTESLQTTQTFSGAFSNSTLVTGATDVLRITGSTTKLIRVKKIQMTATVARGPAIANVTLVRRSTAGTGGTSSNATNASYDTNNTASTAVVTAFTVNQTALGTVVSTIRAEKYLVNAITAAPVVMDWEFGIRGAQSVVLRGTSDYLCLNLGGPTLATGVGSFFIEWTEE